MQNIFLAILFSVLVSAFLKLAKRWQLQIEQIIAFNYVSATGLGYFLLNPHFDDLSFNTFVMNHQMPIFFALGILLPSVFIVMAKAIDLVGIVRSDAAQRLSLFLPILAAFVVFGQTFNYARIIAIIFAFLALICLLKKNVQQSPKLGWAGSVSLILVWFGYGVIDILFKQVAKIGINFTNILFATFVLAGVMLFIYLILQGTQWQLPNVVAGLLLGSLNFGNILFYIKAHQYFSSNPTLVFASMNIGVMILATLVGGGLFKEKITKINLLGIVFGVIAMLSLFYLDRLPF